jgi:hypothetical protein
MQKVHHNNTLFIGNGGEKDIPTALAGGSRKFTAVNLNPLIASAVWCFGNPSPGNVCERNDRFVHR